MAILLQDASSGGGGGQAIAAALSTAVSASCTGWGTGGGVTQDITVSATGQTITIPAIAAGDIAPVAKRITLANVGTNAFTVALSGGTITSSVGLIMNPGSVWTFEAKTLTGCTIVTSNASQGVVPELGEVTIAGQTITSATMADFPTPVNFTLPSAGVWQVIVSIGHQAAANTSFNAQVVNVTGGNTVVPNSQINSSDVSGNFPNESYLVLNLTTTGSNVYKLQASRTIANVSIFSTATSASRITFQKTSGQTPTTGQSIAYGAMVRASITLAIAANTDFTYDTNAGSSGITMNPATGTATIITSAIYDIDVSVIGITNSSYDVNILKNGTIISTARAIQNAVTGSTVGRATARVALVTGDVITARSTNTDNRSPVFRITQLGSSATAQFTGANGTVAGTGGFVPAPAATDNVKFLKGDGTWAAASSALRPYPFTDTMALGEPVEIYNNAGTPSVRKCVQGVAGWGASGNPATIAMNNGNQRIAVVLNANNSISTVNLANGATTTGDVSSAAYANGTYSQSSQAFSTVIASLLASGEIVDFLRATSNRDAATPRVCFWTRGAVNGGRFGIFNVNALGAFSSLYLSPTVNQLPNTTADLDITASGNPAEFIAIFNTNANGFLSRLTTTGLGAGVALGASLFSSGNDLVAIKYVDTNGTTTRFVYGYKTAGATLRVGIGTYNTSTGAIAVVGEGDTGLSTGVVLVRSLGLIGTASPTSDITIGLCNTSGSVQVIRLNAATGVPTVQGTVGPIGGSTLPTSGQIIAHMVPSAFKFVFAIGDGVATNGWQVRECVWDPIGLAMSYPAAAVPYSRTTLGIVETNPFAMPFSKDNPGTGVFAMTDARAGDTTGGPLGTKVVGNTFGTVAVGNYSGLAAEAGTAGQTKNIMLPSGIVAGLTGLTPGQKLYVDSTTNVLTTTNTGVIAAQALSATEVQVRS